MSDSARPTFWRVVWLLLAAARRRNAGRMRRQQQLYRQRLGRKARDWGAAGFVLAVLFMGVLNLLSATLAVHAVRGGQQLEALRGGRVSVSATFLAQVRAAGRYATDPETRDDALDRMLWRATYNEANIQAQRYGGDRRQIQEALRDSVRARGAAVLSHDLNFGIDGGAIPCARGGPRA